MIYYSYIIIIIIIIIIALTKQLIDAGENIKTQIRQQGHEIDDHTLYKTYILVHFESGFRNIQDAVLTELDFEESELEEAVNYYQKHDSVILQDITQKIRTIYKQFGGDIDGDDALQESEKCKNMTVDQALELLNALNEKVLLSTDGFIVKFKNEYGVPTSQELFMAFNQGLTTIIAGAEEEVVSRAGISSNDFQQLIMKFQESPLVRQAIGSMQENQQMLLFKHGIVPQQMY